MQYQTSFVFLRRQNLEIYLLRVFGGTFGKYTYSTCILSKMIRVHVPCPMITHWWVVCSIQTSDNQSIHWLTQCGNRNIEENLYVCLVDLILYVPVDNFSVMSKRVFLGWTSTILVGINLSYSRTQRSASSETRIRNSSVSSQVLYHWATALPK